MSVDDDDKQVLAWGKLLTTHCDDFVKEHTMVDLWRMVMGGNGRCEKMS